MSSIHARLYPDGWLTVKLSPKQIECIHNSCTIELNIVDNDNNNFNVTLTGVRK